MKFLESFYQRISMIKNTHLFLKSIWHIRSVIRIVTWWIFHNVWWALNIAKKNYNELESYRFRLNFFFLYLQITWITQYLTITVVMINGLCFNFFRRAKFIVDPDIKLAVPKISFSEANTWKKMIKLYSSTIEDKIYLDFN